MYGNFGYGQQQYMPQMGNPYFAPQGYIMQQFQSPMNQNALTNEEIQKLMSMRPTGLLNLQIDQNDVLRAICTHKNNGHDVVQQINDGSGDVYCPICGERWNANNVSKEELLESVNNLISQMQNAKWVGELPVNIVREYFTMIPLLKKFPDLFEYGSENMKRLLNQRGVFGAGDANIYAQYNGLFGPGMGFGSINSGYGVPQPGQPYYQQMAMQQQQQMPNNPYGAPQQQPQMMGTPAMPGVNPMQFNGVAPQYGIPGAPGPQPAYYQQMNMQQPQMPGNPYGAPQQPFTPVYGQPGAAQQQQQAPGNPYGAPGQQQTTGKAAPAAITETKTFEL